ncbi:signal peptidase I [Alkalicoccus daliensis]|uniref:Signal peptidase I n=1 Tax=Alkalicoccus daliensis TaxID=745820 RepID=A0A1H0A3U4_9BACI|nr:signal peptidase I [Alkalicoccus daliensis]
MNDSESWQWIKAILFALVLAFIVRSFIFTPVIVEGESMLPTLGDHDRMIVNKLGYLLDEPERFDIIVFHAEEGKDYIKRVIGLPGDKISYKNDILYVNGMPLEEEFLTEFKADAPFLPLTGSFELGDVLSADTVPSDHLFVLGDNRRYSKDSRHIGLVPYEEVVGTAKIVFWPVERLKLVN